MSVKKRRFYDRKFCLFERELKGTMTFEIVTVQNISLGGIGTNWFKPKRKLPEIGSRYRLELEISHPHFENMILGLELMWCNSKKAGLKIVYLNVPETILEGYIQSL